MNIECPSGLQVDLRKILVSDEKVLSDKKLVRSGGAIDALLGACTTSLVDPGIYSFGGAVRWPETLQGDRLYALIRLRALTHGEEYEFRVACPDRSCKHRFVHVVRLDRDLTVKLLPDESRAVLKGDGIFRTEVDDIKIGFKLLTGTDEVKLQQLLRAVNDGKLAASLSQRAVSVEGVEPRDKLKWFGAQDLGFLSRLLAEFEAVDCGVDNEILIECPACDGEFDVNVPFGGDFLMPKTKKKSVSLT